MKSHTRGFSLRHIDIGHDPDSSSPSKDDVALKSLHKANNRTLAVRDNQKMNELITDLKKNSNFFQHSFYVLSCLEQLLENVNGSKRCIYESFMSCDGLTVISDCVVEVSCSWSNSVGCFGTFRLSCNIMCKLAKFSKTWSIIVSKRRLVSSILSILSQLNSEQLEESQSGIRLLQIISMNFPQSLIESNALPFIIGIINTASDRISPATIGMCVGIVDSISRSTATSPLLHEHSAVDKLMQLLDFRIFQDQSDSCDFVLATLSSLSLSKCQIPQRFVHTLAGLYFDYVDNSTIIEIIKTMMQDCNLVELISDAISEICSPRSNDSLIKSLKLISVSASTANFQDEMLDNASQLIAALTNLSQSTTLDISKFSVAGLFHLTCYMSNPSEIAMIVSNGDVRLIAQNSHLSADHLSKLSDSVRLLSLLASTDLLCGVALRNTLECIFCDNLLNKIDFTDSHLLNFVNAINYSIKTCPSDSLTDMMKFSISVLLSSPVSSVVESCLDTVRLSLSNPSTQGNENQASKFICSGDVLCSIVEKVSSIGAKEYSSSDQTSPQITCMTTLSNIISKLTDDAIQIVGFSGNLEQSLSLKVQDSLTASSLSIDDWESGKLLMESATSMQTALSAARNMPKPPVVEPKTKASIMACLWRQQLHENSCVYFSNLYDGQVQWTVPQEWMDAYKKDSFGEFSNDNWKPNAGTIRVNGEWAENVDEATSLLFYENIVNGKRQFEKPGSFPFAHEINLQVPEAEPTPILSSSLKKKAHKIKRIQAPDDSNQVSASGAVETSETPQPVFTPTTNAAIASKKQSSSYSMQHLVRQSRELSLVLRNNFGEQSAEKERCIQEYDELLLKLQTDMREKQSAGFDLFMSFIEALQELLRSLQQSDSLLNQYRLMDSSLQESFENTMSFLKGEVTIFSEFNLADIHRCVESATRSEASCEKMFREAHLQIKRIIVGLAGEQVPNTLWNLTDRDLRRLKDFEKTDVLRQLRTLVVCFDNMTDDQRLRLTAVEIVKNKDWLIKLGRLGLASEKEQVKRSKSDSKKGSKPPARAGRQTLQQQTSFRSVSPVVYRNGSDEVNQRAVSLLNDDDG